MTFQELEIGNYFRISGMSPELVYKKASDSHCSTNTLLQPIQSKTKVMPLLQPIRSQTKVIPLTQAEVANYFAAKQENLNIFWNRSY